MPIANTLRHLVVCLGLAATASTAACKTPGGGEAASGSAAADDMMRRIGLALTEGREVQATVHLEVRPGAGKQDRRVRVATLQYGGDGQVARVKCMDGAVTLDLPGVAFKNALVTTAPLTIGAPRKR